MYLYTPDSLLYPITVTKLLRQPGDTIAQNDALFTYEYKSLVNEWDDDARDHVNKVKSFYANFESEYEGDVASLDVKKGQMITARTSVAQIEEPCRHEIQYGGICADCGKDMTTVQYNSTSKNTERATVNTIHGHTQLLVSRAEASKADEEVKRRLLESRKLSLVVDLDQTIIHATVDPTVAEWQRDPENPNYDAVKHVRAFQLVDDGPGAKGCWYYIKLRPGLEEFLETISQYYELHIYTMGTRAYAENIAKIIDPDRKLFGDRVLSRDESGSMAAKYLKRLFPVDTKMVVIIDDRGDIWHWSPNLVKVSPYDFFVGIGDINGIFLPKRPELAAKPPKPIKFEQPADVLISETGLEADKSSESTETPSEAAVPVETPPQTNGSASAVDRMVSMAGNQDEGTMKEKTEEQDETIAAQLAERPLLQKQKILDAAEEVAKTSPAAEAAVELLLKDGENATLEEASPSSKYRHNLLQDDDTELRYLGQSLRNVHQAYFDSFDRNSAGSKGGRIAELRPGHGKKRSIDELDNIPDAALLMANMKMQVLHGVHLVFSGVVPLGADIQRHDTAIWAKTFGAVISENIGKRTTHMIASPERRTAKVRQAAKRGGRIAIVSQAWLLACFTQWRKVDEHPYRIHSDASANGQAGALPDSFEGNDDLLLSSSDEEAALTEDEREDGSALNGFSKALVIDTDLDELEQYKPTTEVSPISPELGDDWEGMNDELDEFLGSDADDESDTESIRTESTAHDAQGLIRDLRKRKRDDENELDSIADVGEEEGGSRLQKRKKEALARTSSLTQMAKASPSNGATPAAAATGEDPGGGAADDDMELEDDDLEAALAAEMERQSEEDEARTD